MCCTMSAIGDSDSQTNSKPTIHELDSYPINCEIRDQQISYLDGLKYGENERFVNTITSMMNPFQIYLDPTAHENNVAINSDRYNWMLNQIIYQYHQCPLSLESRR